MLHPKHLNKKTCSESLDNAKKDLVFTRLEESSFKKANNISIDNAVMEKTKSSIVMPLNVGWSDIGSWESMWEVANKDKKGNFISGDFGKTRESLLQTFFTEQR